MSPESDSFMRMKDSYICSLHFLFGNGPPKEDHDLAIILVYVTADGKWFIP